MRKEMLKLFFGLLTLVFSFQSFRAHDTLTNADFTFTPDSACSGTAVQFTSVVTSGTQPFTYSWRFGDGTVDNTQNPSHTFTALGCGIAIFSDTLIVRDINGAADTTVHPVHIKRAPDVQIRDHNTLSYPTLSNCSNSPTEANKNYSLTIDNISNGACITTYSVSWGDTSRPQVGLTGASFPLNHVYKELGAFNLVVTAVGSNGCTSSKTYTIYNQSNPAVGVFGPGGTSGCAPIGFWFKLQGYEANSPGTFFTWDFGDNTPKVTWQSPITVDSIFHVFNTSSCDQPGSQFTVKVTAKNGCDSTSATVNNIKVYKKPSANFTAPLSGCTNQPITFTNTSIAAYNQAGCNRTTTYTWNFGDGGPQPAPTTSASSVTHSYSLPGIYPVTLIANGSCGSDTVFKTICISSPPVPKFTLRDSSGCAPYTVFTTNTSDTASCPPTKYKWTVSNYTAGFCGTTGLSGFAPLSTDSTVNPVFIFRNAGTYSISLSITSPCTGTAVFTKTVTVKKKPTVSQPADTIACGLVTFNPRLLVPTCETGLTGYAWVFAGGTPGTSTLLNPGNITFTDTGRHVISLTTSNSCGDTTVSRVLTINPPPNVIPPNDTAVCAGLQSGAFTFTSSTSGTAFSWTNNNISIGLGASGSGNIASFKTTNNTAFPVTATIKVTATKSGCTSPVDSFKITVYPTPNPPVVIPTVNYCQGDAAVALVATASPGDTLIWYTGPTGGTGSRTPIIPPTTAVTSTNYYVSQKNGAGCESGRASIAVTVGAKPKITTSSFTNPASCGATDGTITLSGLTANTSYTVQYTKNGGTPVSMTMAANSSGNIIIRTLGAGKYTNVGVGLNGCFSNIPDSFELVEPNAPVAPKTGNVAAQCSGNTITLTASTTLTGVTFAWTGPNGFTSTLQNPVINTATVAASGTYYVVVKQNNCTSKPDSIIVSVVPTPARPTVPANISVCSRDTLKLSSSLDLNEGITYSWTGPNGFISNQQNPAIPNATIVNNGTYSVIATRANCPSPAASSIVTVKPAATITGTSFVNPSCGAINGTITLNGLSANTSYPVQYTKNGTAVSTTALSDGTGTVVLRGLDAGTYANMIALTNGCSSNIAGPITLQNTPAFAASPASNSPVCTDNPLQLKAGSTVNQNAVYNWTGPNGFNSALRDPVIPHASQADTGMYYVTVTVNGCTASGSVSVAVLQNAAGGRTGADATVCNGTNTGSINLSGSSGRIVRWESSVNNGATWSGISSTSASLTFNNLVATTWFRVLVQNEPCNAVYSDTTIITVNAHTEVPKFNPVSLSTCSHDTTVMFTATVNNAVNSPLTYKWFVNDQIQGVSNPFSYRFRVPVQSITPTQFNIKVLAEYSTGCGDTSQTGSIRINPVPAASINVSPGLIQYQPHYSFTFKDTTASNINRIFSWNMGDGNQRSGKEITYGYGDVGNYLVRLNVNDISTGCSARDSVRVVVIPVAGSLYIPNAFYPNSKKNVLTTFTLAATGLEKFHLQVFDTWGKLLFETTELNIDGSPKVSWNGTYMNNGTPLPQDAYVWKIVEARFKNGQDWEGMSYNGGPAKRIGTVTLFR